MATAVDTNNVLEVKRRALKAQATQFTGKNGAEVVAFAREHGEDGRNGGTYVSVFTKNATDRIFRLRKGDWIVLDVDGQLRGFTNDDFAKFFLIKK